MLLLCAWLAGWTSSAHAAAEAQASVILAPRREAVLSSDVATTVLRQRSAFGESFEKGAVLVELDPTPFQAALRVAEARQQEAEVRVAAAARLSKNRVGERRAEAVLKAAQANLTAVEALHKDRQASAVDLARAERDVALAQADLEVARERAATELAAANLDAAAARVAVDEAKRAIDACTVSAPYAGRVVRLHTREHERTETGQPLIEIVQDTELLAKFLLPSVKRPLVQVGTKVSIRITETKQTVTATIGHIAAKMDPASVTFEVHALIPNADRRLQGGMNGTLDLAEFGSP